ncbi:TonB-dependent receptor domain-containing protein [Alkanindiges sp. WGS2144]|uniref:TonB-dependent receptor domain-containing protein n=1 Tax=Alkanindiges sp. WGS2144 TaxID=3366808 RepID=UPI0037502838
MILKLHPLAVAIILGSVSGQALADNVPETISSTSDHKQTSDTAGTVLPTIVIQAHPLNRSTSDIAMPFSVLEQQQLASGATTLGQALEGQAGVHADTFGGGASRPVIRGQTAPRVKVLADGSEVMDASSISPDHAVMVDPLLSEKIEILRGPATLLYGSGAIGGVVNVIDQKIPSKMPEKNIEGEVNLRANTVADEKAAAAALTVGLGEQFALHLEGSKRDANDYKVRGYAPNNQAEKRVDGTYSESQNASVGLSWIGGRGYAGVAFSQRQDEYGLPGHSHEYEGCHPHGSHLHCGSHDHDGENKDDHAHDNSHSHEDAPYIKLNSKRVDFRAEYEQPFSGFEKIRVRAGYTDYQHDEIDDGPENNNSVATTFKNQGYDGRVELTHVPVAGWQGVLGLQYSHSDFSAQGEEGFLPKTVTENISAFFLEHYQWNNVHFELGARHELQTIKPETTPQSSKAYSNQKFDDAATSASISATWEFVPDYALALSLAHSERMPQAQELYANGIHMATNTYELGDADLKREKSNNIELSLRKTAGDATFALSAYHNRVDDYIYANTLDKFENFRLIQYTQSDAIFNGVEAETRYRFDDTYSGAVFGDYVRAKLDNGQDLPRIPAARLGARIQTSWEALGGELGGALEYYHVFRQSDIADHETTTPGYNLINATLAYDGELDTLNSYRLYLQMNNLLDEKYYSHSSFLSHMPQPGRNFTAGIQFKF